MKLPVADKTPPVAPPGQEAEVARLQSAIAANANDADAHAALGEIYRNGEQHDAAIEHLRTAIGLNPYGPQTAHWKSRLKKALGEQGRVAAKDFTEFRVCDVCGHNVPNSLKTCPRCGNLMKMGFAEWSLKKENLRSIGRESLPFFVGGLMIFAVFSTFPLILKAGILVVGVIWGSIYFLRRIGEGD